MRQSYELHRWKYTLGFRHQHPGRRDRRRDFSDQRVPDRCDLHRLAGTVLVVSAFLHFLLFTNLCKSATCKILFHEKNPRRDKNGTKPQENKIKNASSPTSLVMDFSFLCKGTILSREKQAKSYKYVVNQPFISHGHFREDTASASCTDSCCLFQMFVKIRFMPFVH